MLEFIKMHGLGNDFTIFDARVKDISLSTADLVQIADRRRGVGCDQIVLLKPSVNADIKMLIFNADGSEAKACGNAARCVAKILQLDQGMIEVAERIIYFQKVGDQYALNMGYARLTWEPIHFMLQDLEVIKSAYVDLGNPHMVLFLNAKIGLKELKNYGPYFEKHEFFPDRVNVSFAYIVSSSQIILDVWERGAGITLACGSGACATAFAAYQAGFIKQQCEVLLPGGKLLITITDDGEVIQQGEAIESFKGQFFKRDIVISIPDYNVRL